MQQLPLPLDGVPEPVVELVPVHPADVRARVAAQVHRTDTCWWWLGPPDRSGYGQFWYEHDGAQRVVRAHIFAWELAQPPGAVRNPQTVRMHQCNHTLCVRVGPGHILTGSQRENIAYADALGRRQGRRAVRHTTPREAAIADRADALNPTLDTPDPGEWLF